jgi:hypothetical protein
MRQRELSTYSTACATPWARWHTLKARIESTREVMARALICTLNYAVVSSGNKAPDNDLFKNVLSACSSLESIDELGDIE